MKKSCRSMISKAIIPLAGLGTRMLPITKYLSKEMLPIVNVPAIEFILDELINTSISSFIFIINQNKKDLNQHIISYLNDYPDRTVNFIEQKELDGLGGAVRLTESIIKENEFFLLVLPDNLFLSNDVSRELIKLHEKRKTSVVVLSKVLAQETNKRAIILRYQKLNELEYRIEEIIDKPPVSASKIAISGRYILNDKIFDFITDQPKGKEIELTSALARFSKNHNLIGLLSNFKKFDIGSKDGYYQAFLNLAK